MREEKAHRERHAQTRPPSFRLTTAVMRWAVTMPSLRCTEMRLRCTGDARRLVLVSSKHTSTSSVPPPAESSSCRDASPLPLPVERSLIIRNSLSHPRRPHLCSAPPPVRRVRAPPSRPPSPPLPPLLAPVAGSNGRRKHRVVHVGEENVPGVGIVALRGASLRRLRRRA